MGYIKKLKNNELVGGTDKTTIYPVTSTEAVFEEVGDNEFKSQKYLNNHITNERIVDNTIENDKLKDDTIDMGKLNTQLKTIIQNAYDASWKVKEEPFSLETKYDANDVVYDPDTNSSYVSLTADNQGNPVNPEDEGYIEGKWRIVINGISAVESTEVINETVGILEDKFDTLEGNVDKAIEGLDNRIDEMQDDLSSLTAYETASAPSYDAQIPLKNLASTAQVGYYFCTVLGSENVKQVSNAIVSNIAVSQIGAFSLPPSGGHFKVKMSNAHTATSGSVTLRFGSVTATNKPLYYNGEPVSASNTWEANEVISVYFDGTNYQASNAQGGGGKAEKIKYDNSQSGLAADNVQEAVDEVAVKANIFGTISRGADFGIVDDNGNLLAELANGHVKTKNFDSASVPSYGIRASELDFAITDEVGQDIVQFLNGHIKTKNFYSADVAGLLNIRGKKISIIGDSISTFTGYIPSGYTSFYTSSHPSVNSVEKTWWYQVINKLGLVLGINASWSGCKLTLGENANSTTNAYVACSPKRIEDIGANGIPDIIICFVGTNDFGYNAVIGDYDARSAIPELSSTVSTTTPQNEFADAYAVMINRIRTAYPTAKLFCCTILDRASAFPPTNNVPATMSDYNRKIIELCNNMGVKVIRTHECGISVWNTGTYLQDGLHPKSNGMELISNCVVKELINNF